MKAICIQCEEEFDGNHEPPNQSHPPQEPAMCDFCQSAIRARLTYEHLRKCRHCGSAFDYCASAFNVNPPNEDRCDDCTILAMAAIDGGILEYLQAKFDSLPPGTVLVPRTTEPPKGTLATFGVWRGSVARPKSKKS